MRLKNRNICLFVSVSLFVSCTAGLLAPTKTDESIAKQKWSDANMDQLQKGYHLYVNKCAGCHYLHDPKEYSEQKWKTEIPEMGKRAYLSDLETDLVLRFILTKKYTSTSAP